MISPLRMGEEPSLAVRISAMTPSPVNAGMRLAAVFSTAASSLIYISGLVINCYMQSSSQSFKLQD